MAVFREGSLPQIDIPDIETLEGFELLDRELDLVPCDLFWPRLGDIEYKMCADMAKLCGLSPKAPSKWNTRAGRLIWQLPSAGITKLASRLHEELSRYLNDKKMPCQFQAETALKIERESN